MLSTLSSEVVYGFRVLLGSLEKLLPLRWPRKGWMGDSAWLHLRGHSPLQMRFLKSLVKVGPLK